MNNAPHSKTGPAIALAVESLFDKCVRRKKRTTGSLEIACCLGLWSVEGPDHAFVEQTARHYWAQYYADGEYAGLLSNNQDDQRTKR